MKNTNKTLLQRNRKSMKKGFTLAELLIVVAIIAVLVAVAIPVFTAQLEKSREATDIANMRSAYAYASAALLDDSYKEDPWYHYTNGDIEYSCASFDAETGTAVSDNSISGTGKATKPGLQGDYNLPDGIVYMGHPTIMTPNCIEMYVFPKTGKVYIWFQGEADEGLIDPDEFMGLN